MYSARAMSGFDGDSAGKPAADPSEAEGLHAQGLALLAARDFAKSADAQRRCLALDPSHARAHWALGAALHAERRHDAAAHAYRAAIRADPSFAAAHWDLGAALVEQGSPERAAEGHAALGEALRLEPTFLTAAARPLFAEISQSLATLSES